MEPLDASTGYIEVTPLVVLSQTFPARPSAIPEIRDFVKRCLSQSPLSDEDARAIGINVSQALLDAAGPTGSIQVSFRIFPDHAEVDVLRSGPAPGLDALASTLGLAGVRRDAARLRDRVGTIIRRLDVGRPAPGGADDGSRGETTRRVGQDGEPLGRWRDRTPAARPSTHSRRLRRCAAEVTSRGG